MLVCPPWPKRRCARALLASLFLSIVHTVVLWSGKALAQGRSGVSSFQWQFVSAVKPNGKTRRCRPVYAIPDITCDKTVQVAILGDSIVAGVGDENYGDSGGGYVRRIQEQLPKVLFSGFGTPGQNSAQLYRQVKSSLNGALSGGALSQALVNADIIILDIGRNDWWGVFLTDDPPTLPTYTRLLRLQRFIRGRVSALTGRTPLVVMARLLLPNRGGQGPWVQELNERLAATSSNELPADLRFDLVSKRLYNADQLHPLAAGYDAVAKVLGYYLTKRVPVIWGAIQAGGGG